jgi:chromosome partitioning protein
MCILTVASTKGGVGKSTLVLNIATVLLNERRKVIILDADTQGTLIKCVRVREHMKQNGVNINTLLIAGVQGDALLEIAHDKKQQGYFVLIDSPGIDNPNMRNAILRSDAIVTTCSNSPVDLWEVESLINVLRKLQNIQSRKIPCENTISK